MQSTSVGTAMKATAVLAAAGLLLTGCASGSEGSGTGAATTISQEAIDKAMDTPTTLEFWSWVPEIQKEIDLFEAKYPKVKVNLSNQGGATAQYQKLRTAIAAKDVPDVAQIEYSFLPSFTLTGSILDLAPNGFADLGSDFIPSAWGEVAKGDAVYGLPQDVGPTGQLYRTDIFEAAGAEVPESWDEYAVSAQTIKDHGSYITNLPGNSFSPMLALLWQAGAKPFGFDGEKTVTIDLSSEKVTKVVAFWDDLIQRDLVSTDNQLDDNWYQSIAAGKYASWLAAAWGPVFLQGTAEQTSGLWSAAPLPQWDSAKPASGNQGGSADVVMADSKNPIVAAEFIKFLNHDAASTDMLSQAPQYLFSPNKATLNSAEFTDQKFDFYGGQQVNSVFSDIADTVSTDWQWLPYNDYVSSSFKETLGKAIADKTDLLVGLAEWESQITKYGEEQGFTVK